MNRTNGKSTAAEKASSSQAPTTTKGWTLDNLIALGKRMKPVPRVSALLDSAQMEAEIRKSESEGTPLIIERWHETPCWPQDNLFAAEWLLEHGDEKIAVRDCVSRSDKEVDFKDFIKKCRTIPVYAEEDEKERLYGKDAICPPEWHKWLMKSGLPDMLKPGGTEDVLELLPDTERVETLMCYHGVGDTFTAAHKDLCSSSGQNLMCATEKGGSAFWFLSASKDATRAGQFFHEKGFELDHETYVASPEEFAQAPFTVYVAQQQLGDLVLVPRRSCHQVVNSGGLTTKLSWSRMTVEGLVSAFHHELPIYRRVCRSETYRIKLLVYRALLKFTSDLKRLQSEVDKDRSLSEKDPRSTCGNPANASNGLCSSSPLTEPSSLPTSPSTSPEPGAIEVTSLAPLTFCPERQQLADKVLSLVSVYDKILKEEYQGEMQCELRCLSSSIEDSVPHILASNHVPSCLICDFCGADIFQSFFECRKCHSDPLSFDQKGENIVICPGCFIEGRSCSCTIMTPVQNYAIHTLLQAQNDACTFVNKELWRSPVKLIPLSHQTMHTITHPGLFFAALLLLQTRIVNHRKKVKERACRRFQKHVVTADGALNCSKCHNSRCFQHVLEDGFHASEALIWHSKDNAQEVWHKKHLNARERKQRIFEAMHQMKLADEAGTPCEMRMIIVENARVYRSCNPISNNVKPGWYDDAWFTEQEMPTEFIEEAGKVIHVDDSDAGSPPTRSESLELLTPIHLEKSYLSLPSSDTKQSKARNFWVEVPPVAPEQLAKWKKEASSGVEGDAFPASLGSAIASGSRRNESTPPSATSKQSEDFIDDLLGEIDEVAADTKRQLLSVAGSSKPKPGIYEEVPPFGPASIAKKGRSQARGSTRPTRPKRKSAGRVSFSELHTRDGVHDVASSDSDFHPDELSSAKRRRLDPAPKKTATRAARLETGKFSTAATTVLASAAWTSSPDFVTWTQQFTSTVTQHVMAKVNEQLRAAVAASAVREADLRRQVEHAQERCAALERANERLQRQNDRSLIDEGRRKREESSSAPAARSVSYTKDALSSKTYGKRGAPRPFRPSKKLAGQLSDFGEVEAGEDLLATKDFVHTLEQLDSPSSLKRPAAAKRAYIPVSSSRSPTPLASRSFSTSSRAASSSSLSSTARTGGADTVQTTTRRNTKRKAFCEDENSEFMRTRAGTATATARMGTGEAQQGQEAGQDTEPEVLGIEGEDDVSPKSTAPDSASAPAPAASRQNASSVRKPRPRSRRGSGSGTMRGRGRGRGRRSTVGSESSS